VLYVTMLLRIFIAYLNDIDMPKTNVTKEFLEAYPELAEEHGLSVGDEFEYEENQFDGDPIGQDPKHPKPPVNN